MDEVHQGPDWPAYRRKNGREKPFDVKYFQIGNETWGFKDFNWRVDKHDEKAIRHLFDCIMAVADTLKALDPEVKIITDGVFNQMNKLFEQHARDKIDYLVFHSYQPWGIEKVLNGDGDLINPTVMSLEDTWQAWVATPYIESESGMSAFPGDDLASQNALNSSFDVATTEWNWNGWYAGPYGKADLKQPDLAKGLGVAGFLHALMRRGDKIKLACQSMLVGKSWGITAIRADPDYEQDPVHFPSGQVTGLYSNYHGTQFLDVSFANIPRYKQPLKMNAIRNYPSVAELDILVTRSDQQLFIHVINRSFDQNHKLNVKLPTDISVKERIKRYTLSGDNEARIQNKNLAQISDIDMALFENGSSETEVIVPAASVSVFVFELD